MVLYYIVVGCLFYEVFIKFILLMYWLCALMMVKNFILHFDCLYVLPDNLQVYPDPEERCRLTPACM